MTYKFGDFFSKDALGQSYFVPLKRQSNLVLRIVANSIGVKPIHTLGGTTQNLDFYCFFSRRKNESYSLDNIPILDSGLFGEGFSFDLYKYKIDV